MLRVHNFEASEQAEWTLSGAATFDGDLITLTNPVTDSPFTVKRWSPLPPLDADGDAQLANGQRYYLLDGASSPLPPHISDGEVGFYLKRTTSAPGRFTMWARYDAITLVGVSVRLSWPQPTQLRVNVYDHTGAPLGQFDGTGTDDIPVDAWRLVRLVADGGTLTVKVGERGSETLTYALGGITHTDAGTWAFEVGGAGEAFRLSDGFSYDPSYPDGAALDAYPWPYYAEKLTGEAIVTADAACVLPRTALALATLDFHYDHSCDVGGANITGYAMYLKVSETGTDWDELTWRRVYQGDDLSGLWTINGGEHVRARLTFGNGAEYTARPAYSRLPLTYEIPDITAEEQAMKNVLTKLGALFDGDATVSGYSGYEGAKVSAAELRLQSHRRIGIFTIPVRTVETPESENTHHGIARAKMFDHTVEVYCCIRLNVQTTHKLLMDDGMLLDFTEDVKATLRQENLDETVKRVDITATDYAINVPAANKTNWLVANRVTVMVRSLINEC